MVAIIFILVFGGMVFIHEFGHFLAARFLNIEVEEFGFGFPPRLMTLFKWKGTEFTLNALPLGGFVRPKGENDPSVPDGLAAANPWKRLGVLFAGPLMNFLTAVVVTSIIISMNGMSVEGKVLIENVTEASPAQQAGIMPNDVLVSVNGTPVSTLDAARNLIRAGVDTPVQFHLERNGAPVDITATPLSSRPADQGALGVALAYPRRSATPGEVMIGGFKYSGLMALQIINIPVGLIRGTLNSGEVRLIGMKGIYDILNQAVSTDIQTRQPVSTTPPTSSTGSKPVSSYPTNNTLEVIVSLSLSLAVFNLLPIPALDGGRILFALPEILFKKRIPYKLENVVNGVAMLLLILLMVVINAMDFINPASFK